MLALIQIKYRLSRKGKHSIAGNSLVVKGIGKVQERCSSRSYGQDILLWLTLLYSSDINAVLCPPRVSLPLKKTP
jgi:hypothetical protein